MSDYASPWSLLTFNLAQLILIFFTAGVNRTDSPDQHSISSFVWTTTPALAEVPVETSVDENKSATPVPYTTIVGGAAAGFIIILLLVIIMLLVRMKKRKDTTVRRRTIYGKSQ